MSEITKKELVLTFNTASGKELNLTISKPADSLGAADIKSAMDKVIAAKAFGDGDLVNKGAEAKYVTQQVDKVALA